jgi:hypothetical protein
MRARLREDCLWPQTAPRSGINGRRYAYGQPPDVYAETAFKDERRRGRGGDKGTLTVPSVTPKTSSFGCRQPISRCSISVDVCGRARFVRTFTYTCSAGDGDGSRHRPMAVAACRYGPLPSRALPSRASPTRASCNSTISDFVFFTCSRGQVMQVTPALDWRNLLQMLFFSPHSRPSCVASAPVNVTPSECNARSVACIKQREGIYNLVDKDNVVTLCNCKFRRIWAEGHPSHGVVLWPLSIGLPKISRHLSKA